MSSTHVGLQVVLSQHDFIASGKKLAAEDWKYIILGRFDKMLLEIVDNVHKYSHSTRDFLLQQTTPESRLGFLPETQKLLFVSDGKTNDNERLKKYSTGTAKPYIALVALRLHTAFQSKNRICQISPHECIKSQILNALMRTKTGNQDESVEFFVFQSLGIDDIYVFFGMDEPDYSRIMKIIRELEYWTCNSTCNMDSRDVYRAISTKLTSTGIRYLPSNDEQAKKILVNVERADNKIKEMLTTKGEIPKGFSDAILNTGLMQLWRDEKNNFDSYLLSRLLECIDIIRSGDSMPIILRMHTTVGFKEDVDVNSINRSLTNINVALSMTLRPGASVVPVVERLSEISKQCGIVEDDKDFLPTIGRDDFTWRKELLPWQLIFIEKYFVLGFGSESSTEHEKPYVNLVNEVLDFSTILSLIRLETPPTDSAGTRVETLNEDMILAKRWQEEQLECACKLFW